MNYLLLARGVSLETARVLAVSADQQLVGKFASELASCAEDEDEATRECLRESVRLVPDGGQK